MNELELFAGARGGILGGKLLGWTTVAAVEIEKYPRDVLLQRQKNGILKKFPIWDDVTTFDGKPWNGIVDIISGGFPCQDISAAGKGAGIEGERSGLWKEMARIIGEVRPRFALLENSPMLTSRGLGTVLGDLAEMGYDARWCVLGADDAGAPHRRKRIWILAHTMQSCRSSEQRKQQKIGADRIIGGCETGTAEMADTVSSGLERQSWNESDRIKSGRIDQNPDGSISKKGLCNTMRTGFQEKRPEQQTTGVAGTNTQIKWWDYDPVEMGNSRQQYERMQKKSKRPPNNVTGSGKIRPAQSQLGRMVDGMDSRLDGFNPYVFGDIPRVDKGIYKRVDRLKAIGNGQVPICKALAFLILSDGLF